MVELYDLRHNDVILLGSPCMQPLKKCELTGEDVEAGLLVFNRVAVGGVADYHAGLAHGRVPDQHAVDAAALQLVLLAEAAGRRHSGLMVEVIHVGWHDENNINVLKN